MDLRCKLTHRRGQIQWADGYQIPIGRDGIARNVPPEAAARLLTNAEVWEAISPDGTAAPQVQRGIPIKLHQVGQTVQAPVPPRVVEVSLVPRSLQYLESLEGDQLEDACRVFEVAPPEPEEPTGLVARRIMQSVDEELLRQLRSAIEPHGQADQAPETTAEQDEASSKDAEATAPADAPKGKKGKKAAKSGQPAEVAQS